MTAQIIYGTDFRAKQTFARARFHDLSQAMAPDECFVDLGIPTSKHNAGFPGNKRNSTAISITSEMSIEERVRRSIYHGAGLPYPKDRG